MGHVARREVHAGVQFEKLKDRNHSEDLSVERKLMLKCVVKKLGMKMLTGFN
jgi:hypothetical protein